VPWNVIPPCHNHIAVIPRWEDVMRREIYCEGCGEAEFRLVETYAALDAAGETEVIAWACTRCGDRTEVEVAGFELAEAAAARRVA
jgi:hypothetical protein